MRSFELIPFLAALTNLALTLFVISRGLRSTLNRIYLLWGSSLVIWNFGTFMMFRVTTAAEALWWARFLQFGVIFLPISLFHLSLLIAQIPTPRFLVFVYWLHIGLSLTNFSGFFVAGVRYAGYAYYSIGGPGFWIFSGIYLLLTFSTVIVLYRRQRVLAPLHRKRIRMVLAAAGILIIFGNNDILPILKIDTYPFTHTPIYPLGSAAAIFYGLVVGYSVLQHQLLDVQVTLGRFAAQTVRLTFMLVVGASLLLIASWLSPVTMPFNYYSFFASLAVLLLSALIASLLFPRFFGKGDEALERRILGDRFEYHDKVRGLIDLLQSQPEPQVLAPQLHHLLVTVMRVESFEVILLDETTRGFNLFHAYPDRLLGPVADWHGDTPLFRYFRARHPGYLACKLSYASSGQTRLESAAREQLKVFEPEFCFPFLVGEDPFGVLLLGPKLNGDPFTPQDVLLLRELVQSLGLLLNQVRLKNQVLMSHEQELLGRMSRGLAHDLNNLLTPVQTFLQLTAQGLVDEESRNELLPIASRNIETVRSYVNEALFFSRTHALEVKPLRLDETIRAAVELMQPRALEKNVEINIQGLSTLLVEMDEIMVQRMLGNLISNAIDASPPGGPLKIQVVKLPRTETTRDWIRVKIIDSGEGISPENLQRIFTPYFTTKNRGDGKRGFGLGLAISRKIVHLHGGNLSITSLEQKGTTVQIDLPNRHTQNPGRNPKLTDATYESTYRK